MPDIASEGCVGRKQTGFATRQRSKAELIWYPVYHMAPLGRQGLMEKKRRRKIFYEKYQKGIKRMKRSFQRWKNHV